jgi:hypothetical protein
MSGRRPNRLRGIRVGHEQRDVSCANADVKHAHPGDDSGITKETPRDRVDHRCLSPQTIEFAI